jgi:hypothetical protein
MNSLQILNKNIIPVEMDVAGRLTHDFGQNEAKVVMRLTEGIIKAHLVMGLNIDAQKVNISAVEALKKIMAVYPHAWIDDVLKSLSMASYGEIRLEDQLSNISPANIFGWYKYFRNNMGHLSTSPAPPQEVTMYQLTDQEKNAMMRKSFFAFIDAPNENDMALDIYYQKLIDIGGMTVTDELKNEQYFIEADKMVNAPPYEYLIDKKTRKALYEYQDYYKSVQDKKEFKFNTFSDNFIHKIIIRGAKKRIVISFLKKADKQALMDLYDLHLAKNKK